MTRLERRIHQLIEKAIKQGYVLRTLDQGGMGWVDPDNRDCCLVGALGVGCGLEGSVGLFEVAQATGISGSDLGDMSIGFEHGSATRGDYLYQLGASLRERYVVQS